MPSSHSQESFERVIEQGVIKRLEGLDYTMTKQAIMPDGRIVQGVLASTTQ